MARSVAELSCELLDRLPDAGQLTELRKQLHEAMSRVCSANAFP
jgi:hypothetical protein